MPLETSAYGQGLNVPNESDIASLNYNGRVLVLVVARERLNAKQFTGLRISFSYASGFRMLDESDLAEYWIAPGFLRGYHVLAIDSGGWGDEENDRKGYKSWQREWLVVTGNRCVSVFANEAPVIKEDTFDDDP